MSVIQSSPSEKDNPFVQKFVTDSKVQIQKVILSITDYQQLLERLKDENLYQMMQTVCHETLVNRE